MFAMYLPKAQSFNPEKWYVHCDEIFCLQAFRWIFEKYDGVRAVWNGKRGNMYSRYGNVLPIPNFVTDSLPPNTFLDGEVSEI